MSRRTPRATVVGIMDRDGWDARTDNVVVIDYRREWLLWIPRDLWSRAVGDRINEAYRLGGHQLLCAGLDELGAPVDSSVVVLRSAVERALSRLRIVVPVDRPRRFWYPLDPTRPIEEGQKLISFDPPQETLEGERIHQWLGARKSAETPSRRLPDLDRIERQQVLLGRLLEEGFDFRRVLEDANLVATVGEEPLARLSVVGPHWALRTMADVKPVTIQGKQVLVRRLRLFSPATWRVRR
jgi:anionic cell wall polymer biosynthesis LytR-Cps2A-Psr (LCP) family protein